MNPTEDELKKIITSNSEKAKNFGIKDPNITFLHYLCQRMVETCIVTKDFDIFKLVKQVIEKLSMSDEEKKSFFNITKKFEKEFPNDLKLVNYNLSSNDYKNLSKQHFLGINSNLKFNRNFQPEIFSLILDEKLLDNYELVHDICQIISNCPSLLIVNYILYPKNKDGKLAEEFGFDGQTYQSLYALMRAVYTNKKIKSFIFHSVGYYDINLAPEICKLIEQKLQSETLVSFHFGNFNLNESWFKKIEFLLGSTKSLLFFSYENKRMTKEKVLNFKNVISKNRSILALSIVTPIFSGMKLEAKERIKQSFKEEGNSSKLEFVYLSDQSLVSQYLLEGN